MVLTLPDLSKLEKIFVFCLPFCFQHRVCCRVGASEVLTCGRGSGAGGSSTIFSATKQLWTAEDSF